MPSEDIQRDDASRANTARQSSRSIFAVPAPIKRLFDKFPLQTYPVNDLPLRAPSNRDQNVLYIFSSAEGAAAGAPSYNPSCLKWQTYLKLSNADFRIACSNNHASPSGALPFLLPSSSDTMKPAKPVPSGKLQKWTMSNRSSVVEEPSDLRYEAYLSLLDHRIRRAWLYSLYLTPNFTSIVEPLYIQSTSSNSFVRLSVASDLRAAAEKELLKYSAVIDPEILYKEAEEAFAALETVLGDNEWFFGAKRPGLFDASVFAYTHLLMDELLGNGWLESKLRNAALNSTSLMAHRNRVLQQYFPNA